MDNDGTLSKMNSPENDHAQTFRIMEERRDLFFSSLSDDLKRREDKIATDLTRENASALSKLGKIYRLVDECVAASTPFVACGKGCSNCCKMDVHISALEAAKIEKEIGRKAALISKSILRSEPAFTGIPCPFLEDDACSIYDSRPYFCRQNMSFDMTPHWCDPGRMHMVELPRIRFGGLTAALNDITKFESTGIFADIRDFFHH